MRFSRFGSLTLACLVAFLLAASTADARSRHARGRQGAPKSGHAERTVTRTGPDGAARTSSHESTWQRGDGQWSRDTVHTGPGGKQATTHVEAAKTEDGHVRDATHTGPQGGVTTVEGQGTWDPATKTWTREKVVTRPNGSTSKIDVSKQVTRTTPEPAAAE